MQKAGRRGGATIARGRWSQVLYRQASMQLSGTKHNQNGSKKIKKWIIKVRKPELWCTIFSVWFNLFARW